MMQIISVKAMCSGTSYRLKHRGFLLQDQCLLPTSGHNRLILEAKYFAKSWFEGLRLDDVSDSYWYYVDIVFF